MDSKERPQDGVLGILSPTTEQAPLKEVVVA